MRMNAQVALMAVYKPLSLAEVNARMAMVVRRMEMKVRDGTSQWCCGVGIVAARLSEMFVFVC